MSESKPPSAPKLREVWFSCRANAKCDGNMATITRSFGKSGQGMTTHYRCNTCKGVWVVQN